MQPARMTTGISGTSIPAAISAEFRHPWPRYSIQPTTGTVMLSAISSAAAIGYRRAAGWDSGLIPGSTHGLTRLPWYRTPALTRQVETAAPVRFEIDYALVTY
jgi:hypothetical protein